MQSASRANRKPTPQPTIMSDQPAGVVSTRANVHFIVSEHGTAQLWGMDVKARAKALIAIAAPEHRDALAKAAYARFG